MATKGYLFQTLLAAVQARRHAPGDVEVFLVCLADDASEETRIIASAAEAAGVEFVRARLDALGDLHPKFARLTLDLALPAHIGEVLYLDGDTQITGDLHALTSADLGSSTALAVRDPMVFVREVNPRLRRRIDGWWDESGIAPENRRDYVNSGVLRTTTAAIEDLRGRLVGQEHRLVALRFQDQDAINLAWAGSIGLVSAAWNFPAFLLGSAATDVVEPRVVHFMSEPRPWESALPPWGANMHEPYVQLVRDHPELAAYWSRHTPGRRARYRLQQLVKSATEWRSYRTSAAAVEFTAVEADVRSLG